MRLTRYFNHKGFTLLEIIVSVITVGVLASLALPRFGLTIERVRSSEGVKILTALKDAQAVYNYENGVYTNNIDDLEVAIPDPVRNFNQPIVYATDPVASIERNTGAYTLCIDSDGTVKCDNGSDEICQNLGYSQTCS